MTVSTTLIPLKCLQCETPIPADPNEIAWVCKVCGQGQQLNEDGLIPLEVHFARGIQPSNLGRPFWVCQGRVNLSRETYRENQAASQNSELFWSSSHRFFIPAFNIQVQELTRLGLEMLRNPPDLQNGEPVPFQPVTLSPEDIVSLADFIVMAVEAEREDQIRAINFSLFLNDPELWVLP